METAQPGSNELIDDLVVGHGGFPAHAPDQSKCLHGHTPASVQAKAAYPPVARSDGWLQNPTCRSSGPVSEQPHPRGAPLAEETRHDPDIDVRWKEVRLTLTTRGAGGLTGRGFSLAASMDAL
jgi:4a-hydroxytetrahydrobiopterin dehydratase